MGKYQNFQLLKTYLISKLQIKDIFNTLGVFIDSTSKIIKKEFKRKSLVLKKILNLFSKIIKINSLQLKLISREVVIN